ncbi:hypothetical protein IV203_007049 [Nitzschia inconspicua]|uniref:Uncharacterized protein n=1 Tax=Nitzschia inconspicua TaxID=303405 RepID=A0A9K3KDX6_9STRA|nr:hypothetical protein IV203_007049 [Nitzschia inconspicua]
MKPSVSLFVLAAAAASSVGAFVTPTTSYRSSSMELHGLFDGFRAGGSGRDRLDEEWEIQQAILKQRRAPKAERDAYFERIEERRRDASKKQEEMWGWQSKTYKKGEDPINEWKKRRAAGTISDLEDQYGDPKKIGGIPLPMPSFGVGGEFGVGGKYDNGGRFDLRLPYADQGYVDEDADVMGKISDFFGGTKKKKTGEQANAAAATAKKTQPEKKKGGWPW